MEIKKIKILSHKSCFAFQISLQLYLKIHRWYHQWRLLQCFFIELLTLVHEWKLSALLAKKENHKFVKKNIASTKTNIVASECCFIMMN